MWANSERDALPCNEVGCYAIQHDQHHWEYAEDAESAEDE